MCLGSLTDKTMDSGSIDPGSIPGRDAKPIAMRCKAFGFSKFLIQFVYFQNSFNKMTLKSLRLNWLDIV